MMFIVPDHYPEIFEIVPVGRQKHPYLNYEQDNCDVIINKKFNNYTLRIPASGSFYINISEEQAKNYMKK